MTWSAATSTPSTDKASYTINDDLNKAMECTVVVYTNKMVGEGINDMVWGNILLHARYVMGLFAGLPSLRVSSQEGCPSSKVAAGSCRHAANSDARLVPVREPARPPCENRTPMSYGVGCPQWRRRTKARHGLSIQGEGAGSPCLRRGYRKPPARYEQSSQSRETVRTGPALLRHQPTVSTYGVGNAVINVR